MVKKISGQKPGSGKGKERKQLHGKRLKLKSLHSNAADERNALKEIPADQLPPASTSNAARQVRSRLNITFPVDWQALHLKKRPEASSDEDEAERSS